MLAALLDTSCGPLRVQTPRRRSPPPPPTRPGASGSLALSFWRRLLCCSVSPVSPATAWFKTRRVCAHVCAHLVLGFVFVSTPKGLCVPPPPPPPPSGRGRGCRPRVLGGVARGVGTAGLPPDRAGDAGWGVAPRPSVRCLSRLSSLSSGDSAPDRTRPSHQRQPLDAPETAGERRAPHAGTACTRA